MRSIRQSRAGQQPRSRRFRPTARAITSGFRRLSVLEVVVQLSQGCLGCPWWSSERQRRSGWIHPGCGAWAAIPRPTGARETRFSESGAASAWRQNLTPWRLPTWYCRCRRWSTGSSSVPTAPSCWNDCPELPQPIWSGTGPRWHGPQATHAGLSMACSPMCPPLLGSSTTSARHWTVPAPTEIARTQPGGADPGPHTTARFACLNR